MSGFGDPMRVCVVGAGPRGLSVVERLSANAGERGRGLVVHLVDPHVGTGGRVWSTEQPPSMLMNTVASQVSMFTDESVECEGPVARGPSLYEWARMLPLLEAFDHYPQPVLAEARELGPNSYPTRAFCGHYYNWVLRKLIGTAPPGVRIFAEPALPGLELLNALRLVEGNCPEGRAFRDLIMTVSGSGARPASYRRSVRP